MIYAIAPVIVLLVGLFAFMVSKNPKVADLGRIAFAVGLFVSVWVAARVTLHLP